LAFPEKVAPSLFRSWQPQTIARLIETGQAEQVRKEAEFPVAMQAGCILKKYELSTNASVGLHLESAPIQQPFEALILQDDI